MISRTILKFGQIRPRTAELSALDHLERRKCCQHSSAFILDQNFFILAGN